MIKKGTIQFTKLTQYVKFTEDAYGAVSGVSGDGATNDYTILWFSFTFSFWIKIGELPSQVNDIIRFGDDVRILTYLFLLSIQDI